MREHAANRDVDDQIQISKLTTMRLHILAELEKFKQKKKDSIFPTEHTWRLGQKMHLLHRNRTNCPLVSTACLLDTLFRTQPWGPHLNFQIEATHINIFVQWHRSSKTSKLQTFPRTGMSLKHGLSEGRQKNNVSRMALLIHT